MDNEYLDEATAALDEIEKNIKKLGEDLAANRVEMNASELIGEALGYSAAIAGTLSDVIAELRKRD